MAWPSTRIFEDQTVRIIYTDVVIIYTYGEEIIGKTALIHLFKYHFVVTFIQVPFAQYTEFFNEI